MTRITILEQKLVQLEEKRKQANIGRNNLEEARVDIISRMIHEYFEDVLEEGDVIGVTSERVSFRRPQEGYSYLKDLVELYFKSKDWRDETTNYIQTSFYSTNENSEFELRRMIMIGKVGQIVLDHSDDILRDYNQVIKDTKAEIREQYNLINIIYKDMKFIEDEIRYMKKQSLLDTLENEGIEFELKEGEQINELPNMDVKFDRTIRNIKSIKILSKTASGKSANIALKIMNNIWNSDTQSYNVVQEDRILDKVRMNNIERFLEYNSKRISAS